MLAILLFPTATFLQDEEKKSQPMYLCKCEAAHKKIYTYYLIYVKKKKKYFHKRAPPYMWTIFYAIHVMNHDIVFFF